MNKAEKAKKFMKKHWITVWMIVAIVACGGAFTFAKFDEGQNYAKKVISTGKNEVILFTSNVLSSPISRQPQVVGQGYSNNITYDINIYNHDKKNEFSYYSDTIKYTLKATLVKTSGTTAYNIGNANDLAKVQSALLDEENSTDENSVYKNICIYRLNNGSQSNEPIISLGTTLFEQSLTTEQLVPNQTTGSATNSYRVVIPPEAIDSDVYLKVTAEPNGYADLPESIGSLFYAETQTVNLTPGWEGYISENQNSAPSLFDAFNFTITGGGEADKILKWNKTYVQPNKAQIEELASLNGNTSFTYTVDTDQLPLSFPLSDNSSLYTIQFYVKGSTARTHINSFVTVKALMASGIITLEDQPAQQ